MAAAALADAAQHADYNLTRQEAAAALASFPGQWVAGAAAAAAHDTLAAVRAAAAGALAGTDSGAAIPRLQQLLHDPSYDVRAASLTALIRIDPADRATLIAQGLSTPSYQDVIQNAALGAAAASKDTSLIPTLDSLARDNRGAMLALASFARQGNAHATALLSRALDDDQDFVRQSALIAIVRGLPAAQALETLRARASTLTHPDMRALVERLIPRLAQRVSQGQSQP